MTDHNEAWQQNTDTWESERVNDRDEWDLHVRHVEDDDRDRLEEKGA